jgi:hypothetical protein
LLFVSPSSSDAPRKNSTNSSVRPKKRLQWNCCCAAKKPKIAKASALVASALPTYFPIFSVSNRLNSLQILSSRHAERIYGRDANHLVKQLGGPSGKPSYQTKAQLPNREVRSGREERPAQKSGDHKPQQNAAAQPKPAAPKPIKPSTNPEPVDPVPKLLFWFVDVCFFFQFINF